MTQNMSLAKTYSSDKNAHMGRGSRPVTVSIIKGDAVVTNALQDVEGIGFTWGYNGRREINLAHSIIVDYFEDPDVPRGLWIAFFDEVLSSYSPEDEWDITGQMISEWIYRRFPVENEAEQEEQGQPAEERRQVLDDSYTPMPSTSKENEEVPLVSAGTIGIQATPSIAQAKPKRERVDLLYVDLNAAEGKGTDYDDDEDDYVEDDELD